MTFIEYAVRQKKLLNDRLGRTEEQATVTPLRSTQQILMDMRARRGINNCQRYTELSFQTTEQTALQQRNQTIHTTC